MTYTYVSNFIGSVRYHKKFQNANSPWKMLPTTHSLVVKLPRKVSFLRVRVSAQHICTMEDALNFCHMLCPKIYHKNTKYIMYHMLFVKSCWLRNQQIRREFCSNLKIWPMNLYFFGIIKLDNSNIYELTLICIWRK